MKTKSREMLPKTTDEIANGGLYRQAVRCGKDQCRCASGVLHEGYFYFIRRVGGRLRKTYVPKDQVVEFAKLVKEARSSRGSQRMIRRSSSELLAEMKGRLREYEALITNLNEALKHNG
jgi:hypothetical protein